MLLCNKYIPLYNKTEIVVHEIMSVFRLVTSNTNSDSM
jgi:hypothetical protein